MAEKETTKALDRPTPSDLPSLVQRLAENVAELFEQKIALLKVELKEEIDAYVRGSIVILAGGIVAAVGFALTNIALAFAISTFFVNTSLSQSAKYALGFVITGLLYLIVGTLAILIAKNHLAKQGIIPRRTLQELERDKEWLQEEI